MMGRANQDGVALLLALLMVVLLTVIVVEFGYEMQVEASLAANQVDEVKAYLTAKSAIAIGMSLLSSDLLEQQSTQATDSHQDVWWTTTHPNGEGATAAIDQGFYQRMPDGKGEFTVVIDDEWGKIPLNALIAAPTQSVIGQNQTSGTNNNDNTKATTTNSATSSNQDSSFGTPPVGQGGQVNPVLVDTLHALFTSVLGMKEDPTDAIVDWIDEDDTEYGPNGAEQSYYDTLDPPYRCKNGPLNSVQELLMVRGITPEVFFGNPDQNIPPLYDLVTVHGNPNGQINANTAPYEVLLALEQAGQGRWAGLSDEIRDQRLNSPFLTKQDMRQRLSSWPPKDPQNPDPQPDPPLVVLSKTFHIQGDAFYNGVKTRIDAYVWRDMGEGTERFRVLDWRVTR